MSGTGYRADLDLALDMATAADELTRARFLASDLKVETKLDMTPVTEADRAVEERLRSMLGRERPGDAILGEEYGASGTAERRWIIDPIDGTKNYVRGIPVFATLVALAVGDTAMVGVVSAPELGRRWWAARGEGAFVNGRSIRVSRVARLADAQLSIDDLRSFRTSGYGKAADGLSDAVWRVRGFGDFWSHVLVAEGAVDIAVEPEVSAWDLAAPQVIVEEAGGRFTDLKGKPGFRGGSVLATNGLMHDQALEFFAGAAVEPASETE